MSYNPEGSFHQISGPSAVSNASLQSRLISQNQSPPQAPRGSPSFVAGGHGFASSPRSNTNLGHRREFPSHSGFSQFASRQDEDYSGSSQQRKQAYSARDLPLQSWQEGTPPMNNSFLARSNSGSSLSTAQKSPALLPALPILSSRSDKGKRRAEPSPPHTPPFPFTPQLGSPSVAPVSGIAPHPWDTPGPSVIGSAHGDSVSPQRAGYHARQLSLDQGTDTTLVAESKSTSHPRTPVFGASQAPYRLRSPPRLSLLASPHRESFARRGRSSDEDGEGSGYVMGGPSDIWESEEDFLRNVQRVVDSDQYDYEEERTPSPLPGIRGKFLSPPESYDRSTYIPSPLGSPTRDSQRAAGGELNRLLSARAEWERARRLEFDKRRPDYLRRWAIGDSGASDELSPTRSAPKRRPHTRRGRQRRSLNEFDTGHPADRGRPMHTLPNRTRTTRAMDAREAEYAIAAVNASLVNPDALTLAQRTLLSEPNGLTQDPEVLDPNPANIHASSTQTRRLGPSTFLSGWQAPTKTTIIPGTGVGITVSPVKGRRLKLIRQSSPPASSRRNSVTGLTAPTKFFSSRGWSPPPSAFNSSSRHSDHPSLNGSVTRRVNDGMDMDGDQGSTTVSSSAVEDGDSMQDSNTSVTRLLTPGRVTRKRKRLLAFQDDSSASDEHSRLVESGMSRLALSSNKRLMAGVKSIRVRQSPLKAAFVEGLGRMAVNPNDLEDTQVMSLAAIESGTAGKKTFFGYIAQDEDESLWSSLNTGGAGFRDIVASRTTEQNRQTRKVNPTLSLSDPSFLNGAHWPDSQFPWSLNDQQRREERKRLRNEKLKLVERFLERDTDDESLSEDGENSAMTTNEEDSVDENGIVEGARGLWALGHDGSEILQQDPQTTESQLNEQVPHLVVPSDPGDARYAFASRRDIRVQLFQSRRRLEEETRDSGDEGPVACVCREPEDSRRMVRCDGCRSWFHQICVGIHDETQLDDFWYCWKCTRDAASVPENEESLAPATTIVVPSNRSEPESQEPSTRQDQDSVMLPPLTSDVSATSPFTSPPKSPVRLPSFPSPQPAPRRHFDPSTPKRGSQLFGIDVQQTPRFFPEFNQQLRTAGSTDITGTPSRGTQYNVAFATLQPRRTNGVPLFTPKTPTSRRFDGPSDPAMTLKPDVDHSGSTMKGSGGGSSPPLRPYSMSAHYLDTPIQRGGRMGRTPSSQAQSGFLAESPLRPHELVSGRLSPESPSHSSSLLNGQRNNLNDMVDV